MYQMFKVRSSPCPAPNLQSSLHCTRWTQSPPSAGPHPRPAPRMPSSRHSTESVGVQPAAELRHLQRHEHVPDVRGALLPVSCPRPAVELSSPARCVDRGHPPPSRLSGRTSPRTVCPPFGSRQYASAFNQPLSFDTSSVTNMGYMFH
eukprot:scaffold112914_cov42-Phaeocystis_antarctica.AAC.1